MKAANWLRIDTVQETIYPRQYNDVSSTNIYYATLQQTVNGSNFSYLSCGLPSPVYYIRKNVTSLCVFFNSCRLETQRAAQRRVEARHQTLGGMHQYVRCSKFLISFNIMSSSKVGRQLFFSENLF